MDGEDSGTDEVSRYVYNGVDEVPMNVTHVRVDPSVTVIPDDAFRSCKKLEQVDLPEGLIQIGHRAFSGCNSLKIINIPSTVESIGNDTFNACAKLKVVVLPEGLRSIGWASFSNCHSLLRINIPPGIEVIKEGTCCYCYKLTEVILSEGIEVIGQAAFKSCNSLVSVTLPSSLKVVGVEAFEGCDVLNEIHIPDTIEKIHTRAFKGCNFTNFRIPPSLGNFLDISIVDNTSLVSLELPESVTHMPGKYPGTLLETLRNVAFPSKCVIEATGHSYKDLWLVFPGGFNNTIITALRQRFDDLPIHKMCYYQSYHDTEHTLQSLEREINQCSLTISSQVNTTGKDQDCLGMTPLHILACSTKQNMDMYWLLIDKYPETLIIKDKWGDIPLLYAIWCNSPSEVIDLLVESYKTYHPEYEFDWSGMIRTLVKRHVPLANIQRLVSTHRNSFSDQCFDIQALVIELAAYDKGQERFLQPQCTSIETFKYLLQSSITRRLDSLGISRWTVELENFIKFLPEIAKNRDRDTQKVYDRLATYESIKEGTSVLELTLWKLKINEDRKKARVDSEVSHKGQYRINCGADIIMRNVLPYLLPLPMLEIEIDDSSDESSDDSIDGSDNSSDDLSDDSSDSSDS